MLHRIFKGIVLIAAVALGAGLSACDGMNFNMGGKEGVPLSELDMSGDPPRELVLAGPDTVLVREGEALAIEVGGDREAVDALRFSREGDTLGITRQKSDRRIRGRATVNVTMPAPRALVLAGSGRIETASLVGDASVTIAGSGHARTQEITADRLEMTLAGSGTYEADGEARDLELTIAGSGTADMRGVKVGTADVTVAGSGEARFASDGTVEANIMGSGEVTVVGRARCTVNSIGSGSLRCEAGVVDATGNDEAPPMPPAPPEAPRG